MDLPETRGDLWMLYSRYLAPRIASGAAMLVLACGSGAAAVGATAATRCSGGHGKGPGRLGNSMGSKHGSSKVQ